MVRECGDDGCGGQCGWCQDGTYCNASGQCEPFAPTKTCIDMVACAQGCPKLGKTCVSKCQEGGDAQSQAVFMKLVDCVFSVCGTGSTIDCAYKAINGPCIPQYIECKNDSAP